MNTIIFRNIKIDKDIFRYELEEVGRFVQMEDSCLIDCSKYKLAKLMKILNKDHTRFEIPDLTEKSYYYFMNGDYFETVFHDPRNLKKSAYKST